MTAELQAAAAGEGPMFMFHLGDVVYSFGEHQYYYDQFYEPFRAYDAADLRDPRQPRRVSLRRERKHRIAVRLPAQLLRCCPRSLA